VIRPSLIAAATVGIVLLCGCQNDAHSQDAVRQGVMTYLAKRADLLAMDVNVTSVSFRQDEATAQVHFQAKGNSSPAAGMNMEYVLDRKDGQWVVRGRTGAGAAHGASGPAVNSVPGQGTLPGSLDGMPALPPGHPSVSSDSTTQQR
jgi:outer membrane murein-binding lipoprotein Lpp